MSQWKLVPVEPTEEMVEAISPVLQHPAVRMYRAMLAAAPQPAGEPVGYVGEIAEGVELYLSRNDFVGRSIPLFTYPPDAQARIAELEKQRDELVKALRKISQMAYARSPEQKTANEALAIAKVNTGGI